MMMMATALLLSIFPFRGKRKEEERRTGEGEKASHRSGWMIQRENNSGQKTSHYLFGSFAFMEVPLSQCTTPATAVRTTFLYRMCCARMDMVWSIKAFTTLSAHKDVCTNVLCPTC